MQKTVKYTIFKTRWCYFGLAATDNALLRTCLPPSSCFAKAKQRGPERKKVKLQLLQNFHNSQYEKGLFKALQNQIISYFDGARVNFGDIPIVFDGLSVFTRRILTACRDIGFGQTVSYGRLAKMAGYPGSARAVGGALAKNPLPLIIPCHRVICSNGSLGGFSAPGGVNLKKKLLKLEESSKKEVM
jgi:methylated-DNA-[protein]-cysteine S-methyltransferase